MNTAIKADIRPIVAHVKSDGRFFCFPSITARSALTLLALSEALAPGLTNAVCGVLL